MHTIRMYRIADSLIITKQQWNRNMLPHGKLKRTSDMEQFEAHTSHI